MRRSSRRGPTLSSTQPALANIDYCQSHPEEAEAVNVAATAGLADLCAETGARLVFCSTDTVFDGETGMYREDARPVPVNTYAETKVRAEEAVLSRLPSAAVARLSLVIGLPVLGAGNSFLAKLLPQIERGESVSAPADEIRTPVDVITLGRALLELAGNDFAGFIHLAGNDRMSRLEMVKRIAVRVGQSPDIVSAASGSATPGRAPRPRDVSLDNSLAQHTLSTPMQGIDGALDLIFDARKGIFP